MSCGWGDRLAGFYCSNAEHYIGFDPSTKTFPKYLEQIKLYDKLMPVNKKTTLLNEPAEDVDYDSLPMVDLFFSSPPYFLAEQYEDHPSQSWVRYKTIDAWQYDFLHVVLRKAWDKINEGGHMLINISDIVDRKDHTRIHICDKMCDYIDTFPDAQFVGYYGMKLTLRPNNTLVDKDENMPYIEPIWVYRKGDPKKKKDISRLFV